MNKKLEIEILSSFEKILGSIQFDFPKNPISLWFAPNRNYQVGTVPTVMQAGNSDFISTYAETQKSLQFQTKPILTLH